MHNINTCYCIDYGIDHVLLFRGVPGVDWRVDDGETINLSKLYYNTFDPDGINVGIG